MSRSFQQTSLSAAGLFITDSGIMAAVKFRHAEKLFFRCVINFCFFTATDLCDNVSFHSYMFLSNCLIFSSSEPKAPGELIVYAGSVVRCPSSVRPQFRQTTSPLKLLGRLQPNFIYSLQGL